MIITTHWIKEKKSTKPLSPLWKMTVLHFPKKILNTLNPSFSLCQSWLKLAQCFWRRFINVVKVFSLSLLSPHGISFIQGCFVPCLVEFSPVILETNMKMFTTTTTTDNDKFWSLKLIWAIENPPQNHIRINGVV